MSTIVYLKGVFKEVDCAMSHREKVDREKVAKLKLKNFVTFIGESCFIARRDERE